MRKLSKSLSIVAVSSLMACSGGGQTGSGAAPSSSAITPAPTAMASSTTTAASPAVPTQAVSASKPARKAPRNYAALQAELAKKCPVAKANNTLEEKEALMGSIQCLKKKMNADLDAVLIPLKTSDPAKFKALMKEQAEWNKAMEKACDLEEERTWVDFTTGHRDDGSFRSYTMLGCFSQAFTERTMYARTLASGKIAPLVKHIEESRKGGAAVKGIVADIQKKAIAFKAAPPPQEDGFLPADWDAIIGEAGAMIGATQAMAKSTCGAWPELEKALGGPAKCLLKAELYYYVQGNNPSVDASL